MLMVIIRVPSIAENFMPNTGEDHRQEGFSVTMANLVQYVSHYYFAAFGGGVPVQFVQPIRDEKKIDAMKQLLRGRSLRDYCLFTLGINSGLRIGDLLALVVADVVDDRGRVKDRITVREQKTGKTKDFPLGRTTVRALKDYLDDDPPVDRPLFPSRKGGHPISRQHAHHILAMAARAVGITEPIGTHTLRKTFGYHAYKKGTDVTRIQKLLNHSAPSVTLAYIGITQEELDNVYLTMNL